MNSQDKSTKKPNMKNIVFPAIPANNPIELLYEVGGQFHYSAHCCDEDDPDWGVIISGTEIDPQNLGCDNGLDTTPLPGPPVEFGIASFSRPGESNRIGLVNRGSTEGEVPFTKRSANVRYEDIGKVQFVTTNRRSEQTQTIVGKLNSKSFDLKRISYIGWTPKDQPIALSYYLCSRTNVGNGRVKVVGFANEDQKSDICWLTIEGNNRTNYRIIVSAKDLL